MKAKRTIALVLAAVSALTLASCGKKPSGGMTQANGKWVPNEEIEVNIWYTQGTNFTPGDAPADDVVAPWVYDKTKVVIGNIYGNDGGQWDVKLSRLITADNLPELIICGAGQGPTHFARLNQAKKLLEIKYEDLEKYAPNVLKRIPEETLKKFEIDGKLYGIPFALPSSETTQPDIDEEGLKIIQEQLEKVTTNEQGALYIRDDILKQIYPEAKSWAEIEELAATAGGPIGDQIYDIPIKTTEEYIDFMYKIKEMNVQEEGKQVYAFGYSGGDNWEALTYMGGQMMGYNGLNYVGTWDSVNNKVNVLVDDEIVKQAAKNQNKMLNDQVIDPESCVHTTEMFKEKVNNGRYAIAALDYAGGINLVNGSLKASGKSYQYRPFRVQIPNLPEYTPAKTTSEWTYALAFTSTLGEENLPQMLNYLNVTFSDEFEEVFCWGPEEAGLYTEDENGKRTFTDERFTKRYCNDDGSALEIKDTRGIWINNGACGSWYPTATSYSRWQPGVYNKDYKLNPNNATKKFEIGSEHIMTVEGPDCSPWAPEFANVQSVVDYWAAREKWENPIKIAIAARSEEFDKKWQEAMDVLNGVADIKKMEEEMTAAITAK